MNSRVLVLMGIFLMAIGCSKDNSSGGGPSISIKSYPSQVYNNGQDFAPVLNFSQSGGNISGDSLVIIEHRYGTFNIVPDNIFPTRLPFTPSASKAEFTAHLSWMFIQYGFQDENDTVDFKFVLIDQNMKHSDTVTTGKVIIYQF